MERALLGRHAADMALLCESLRPETVHAAAELAAVPNRVRGYGPVKGAQFRAANVKREALLAEVGRAETMEAA
jgi:indolepyruvate ferredoxin oxidoreductase